MSNLTRTQRRVVDWDRGDVLVTGRAGTGKTLVLTRHAAEIVDHEPAEQLLFLAGTESAARRVDGMITSEGRDDTASCRVTTTQSLAAGILREHGEQMGMDRFSLLDSEAAKVVITEVLKRLGYRASNSTVHDVWREIRRSKGLVSDQEPLYCGSEVWADVRPAYGRALSRMMALDKCDLVPPAADFLREAPSVLDQCHEQWSWLYVDDLQNCTEVDLALIRLLAGSSTRIVAASDPHGRIHPDTPQVVPAKRLWEDRTDPERITLDRSFRPPRPISLLAGRLIGEDEEERCAEGESNGATVVEAGTTEDEARGISERLEALVEDGCDYSDVAVFTRGGARKTHLVAAFREKGIPVRDDGVATGEVRRDVLAYLQVAAHPHDDARLFRVINTPSRGIGAKTQDRLRQYAVDAGVSAWTAIRDAHEIETLGSRARRALSSFQSILETYVERSRAEPPSDWVRDLIDDAGYLRSATRTNTQEQLKRRERVESVLRRIEGASEQSIDAVLQNEWMRYSQPNDSDGVTVCQVGEAAGLEFPVVFLAGMEEGVFPDGTVMRRQPLLRADRRLLYVGMTRAQERLFLTWARSREEDGEEVPTTRSRFLESLDDTSLSFENGPGAPMSGEDPSGGYDTVDPHYFRQPLRVRQKEQNADPNPTVEDALSIREVQRIEHPSLGTGTVLETKTEDDHRIAVIDFDERGEKSINLQYASLTVIDKSS